VTGARNSLFVTHAGCAAVLVAVVSACASSSGGPAPAVSTTTPPRDTVVHTLRGATSRPALIPGRWRYQVASDAVVTLESDSAAPGSPIHSVTTYTIVIDGAGDTLTLAGRVDSLSRTVGGQLPPIAGDTLRPGFAAMLTRRGVLVQLHDSTATPSCPTGIEPPVAGVRALFASLPPELAPGVQWTDSVTTESCRGNAPITTTYRRTYAVDGAAQWKGDTAWHATVRSIFNVAGHATGRGGDSLTIAGTGESAGVLLLDPTTGMILHATAEGSSTVTLQTSRGAFRFRQRSSETIDRLPAAAIPNR